ncbi:hypothetical protein LguiB_012720 [Lonicera macranthoides]
MQESFPELGILKEDCIEISWIESILYFAGFPRGESFDVLLDRTPLESTRHYKAKSDYVRRSISEKGLEGIWKFFDEDEAEAAQIILNPSGGRMIKKERCGDCAAQVEGAARRFCGTGGKND